MAVVEESDNAPLLKNDELEEINTMGSSAQLYQSEPKTYWLSIYIVSALSFTGSSQFSIYFSTLWPYLQVVSKNFAKFARLIILNKFF